MATFNPIMNTNYNLIRVCSEENTIRSRAFVQLSTQWVLITSNAYGAYTTCTFEKLEEGIPNRLTMYADIST